MSVMFARRNVMLPANAGTSMTSSSAGTKVTAASAAIRMAAFPAMYCVRVIGRERYNCSAFARMSSAIKPEPTYTVMKKTSGSCWLRKSRNVCGEMASTPIWDMPGTFAAAQICTPRTTTGIHERIMRNRNARFFTSVRRPLAAITAHAPPRRSTPLSRRRYRSR